MASMCKSDRAMIRTTSARRLNFRRDVGRRTDTTRRVSSKRPAASIHFIPARKATPALCESIRKTFRSIGSVEFIRDHPAVRALGCPARRFRCTPYDPIPQRPAGELLVVIAIVEQFLGQIDHRCWYSKQLPTTQQLLGTVAIRQ